VLLASGDEAGARAVVGRDRYWSRARIWLRDHPLGTYAARFRARAQMEQFDAHPAELKRIAGRPDVLVTGASAAHAVGLVGPSSTVEVYAPVGHRSAIVEEHALVRGGGPVRIRWVPDELWPYLGRDGGRNAPRFATMSRLCNCGRPLASLPSDSPGSGRSSAA
jgi:hypothetical protein